ncbi:MAG: hypothetical protein ACR2MC_10195 [Actinomycetota bacterium]
MRYANEGLAALADESSKQDRCPHQMAPEVEARIVEMRRAHPGLGAAHDPQQATPRARRCSVALGDLSLPRAPSVDPTEAETTPTR